jgi:hypothetical protein
MITAKLQLDLQSMKRISSLFIILLLSISLIFSQNNMGFSLEYISEEKILIDSLANNKKWIIDSTFESKTYFFDIGYNKKNSIDTSITKAKDFFFKYSDSTEVNLTNSVIAQNNSTATIGTLQNNYNVTFCVIYGKEGKLTYSKVSLEYAMANIIMIGELNNYLDSTHTFKLKEILNKIYKETDFKKITFLAEEFRRETDNLTDVSKNNISDVEQLQNDISTIQMFSPFCGVENIDVERYDKTYVVNSNSLNEPGNVLSHILSGGVRLFQDKKTQKYGYMNGDGLIVIYPKFETATDFKDGVALVSNNNNYRFIDVNENIVFSSKYNYDWIAPFSEGFATAYKIESKENGYYKHVETFKNYFILNKNGEDLFFNKEIKWISNFKHGLAIVNTDVYLGIKDNKFHIFSSDSLRLMEKCSFNKKYYDFNLDKRVECIDGNKVSTANLYKKFENVYVMVNEFGEIVTKNDKTIWNFAYEFNNYGFCVVCEDWDVCYLIDTSFNKISNRADFYSKGFLNNRIYIFRIDYDLIVVNEKGHTFSDRFSYVEVLEDVIIVKKKELENSSYSLFNYEGVEISSNMFYYIEPFDDYSFWCYSIGKDNNTLTRTLVSFENNIYTEVKREILKGLDYNISKKSTKELEDNTLYSDTFTSEDQFMKNNKFWLPSRITYSGLYKIIAPTNIDEDIYYFPVKK